MNSDTVHRNNSGLQEMHQQHLQSLLCICLYVWQIAYSVAIIAGHRLHEGLHGLRPLLLGRAAYLLHDSWRQAVPVALTAVSRTWHRDCASARLMRLLTPLHHHAHRPYAMFVSYFMTSCVLSRHLLPRQLEQWHMGFADVFMYHTSARSVLEAGSV